MASKRKNIQRCNENMQCWLQLNRLLAEVGNSELINHCDEIYNSFGDELEIINFMIKYGNTEQLQRMKDCITSIQRECKNKQKQNKDSSVSIEEMKDIETESVESTDDNQEEGEINYFQMISTASIETICEFLDRDSIRRLKRVSCRIGIICLKEMNKSIVKVLNGNKLIGSNLNAVSIKFSDMMTKYRETSQKQYYSLFEKWANIYPINEENQLLFRVNHQNDLYPINTAQIRYLSIMQYKPRQIRHIIYNPRSFLLIDKRNTIILNANNARVANKNDAYESLKEHKLYLLQYFDVRYQTLKIIQFLMISPNTIFKDITNYIEQNFIHTTNDRRWHKRLSTILDNMYKDPLQEKLLINQCTNRSEKKSNTFPVSRHLLNSSVKTSNGIDNVIVFEINCQHIWCRQSIFLQHYKLKLQRKLQEWHPNFHSFYSNYIAVRVCYQFNVDDLKNNIVNYINTEFDGLPDDLPDILENIDQFKEDKGMTFYVSNASKCGVLQHEIASIIPYLDADDIQLSHHPGSYRWKPMKWNKPISHYAEITAKKNIITFEIVSYNNLGSISHDQTTMQIEINIFDHIPKLFDYQSNNRYQFKIIYKKRCKVIDLIKHLQKSIELIPPINIKQYELLLNMFQSHMECNNYNFILNGKYCEYYTIDDKIDQYTKELKLFIYPRITTDDRSILYKVRFAKRSKINSNKKIWDNGYNEYLQTFTGLPIIAWINETDTVQYIIDNYLNQYKRCITASYIVYPSEESIYCVRENERSLHALYEEDYPESFVTFAIKASDL